MFLKDNQSTMIFVNTLCGQYSNQEQAYEEPQHYAKINIFFRLLPWSLFKGISIYSEQSYDYSPWNPYRQSVYRLSVKKKLFTLVNYKIRDSERIAGAGFNMDLLNQIQKKNLSRSHGCEVQFQETTEGCYSGGIKKGKQCLTKWGDKETYIVSKIEVKGNEIISIDEGYDVFSNKKVWGSEHGPFHFKKIH